MVASALRKNHRNKAHRAAPKDVDSLEPGAFANAPSYFIESLDLEGRGVARREDGKVLFIEGALPFETVKAQINIRKANWEVGVCVQVLKESSQRVNPECEYFGLKRTNCGGCKMQHLDGAAQVAIKQRVLEDNLWHIGRVKPMQIMRAIHGPQWEYRYRARLSVRYVKAREHALVGFHERQSRYIADIHSCKILPAHVSHLLLPLRALISALSVRESCPQIEVACGDEVTALVLRHLEPLSSSDQLLLKNFAHQHNVQWWLQPGGTDSLHLMEESETSRLGYTIKEFDVRMPYRPQDFTQVNPHINEILVSKAIKYLQVQAGESVVDWFCGLGNFTLPLATVASKVLGIEGSEILVSRARENFEYNQLKRESEGVSALSPTDFVVRNLFEMTPEVLWEDGSFDKWLLDPPREGCMALVKALAEISKLQSVREGALSEQSESGWKPPKRIVYVSCNPASWARDALRLIEGGYRLADLRAVGQFRWSTHVELVSLFVRDQSTNA